MINEAYLTGTNLSVDTIVSANTDFLALIGNACTYNKKRPAWGRAFQNHIITPQERQTRWLKVNWWVAPPLSRC